MDHFEVTEALSSFRILVDNREQGTPKAIERYNSFGVPYSRTTLNYGDYCGIITIDGTPIYDASKAVKACCVIERKMSLDELAMCFTRGRDRFRREMERATSNGATVYLLIENGSYEAIINHRYRSKYNSNAFLASLTAWTVRYNLRPVFCKADTSGALIKEILYRDMKERLERGEYG
jgi:ERCC4-type nuclease